MTTRTSATTVFCIACASLLNGCFGGSSSGSGAGDDNDGVQPEDVQVRQFDASDHDEPVHVDLSTGEVLTLSAGEAADSEAWDIALQRHQISLNGGTSGPGRVQGALLDGQASFYNEDGTPNASVFTNTGAADTLDALLAPVDAVDSGDWVLDSITTEFGDDWYIYDFATGEFQPDPDNGWLLRSGTGDSYARVRITELDFDSRAGDGVEHFRFEFDVQVPNTQQFTETAVFTGSLPGGGGDLCFDVDSDATADCSGVDWDIQIGFQGQDFYLRSNSGVSGDGDGGVFGPFPWSELEAYDSATVTPSGESIAGHYQPDASTGIFDAYSWYAYNLTGQHQLWPNYRVYLIDSDHDEDAAAQYALQVINYYDGTGDSGHPELRWRQVD
ncbi:HmuY family protein [Aquisalimonas asiatica]|uniref:HmuY protein n=1 Tax=Aquisalimonas asiatica TaxID=406100 RepID=A0A1H8SXD4_9GAMM|nr:HmuY family protein [Aquisalimonas asiatica]SEO83341.1 HmuY protein [Aquisalimonas asiatica]